MSGALTGLATGLTFAAPALSATGLLPAWIRQGRKIGKIIPDVTIEERHTDRLQVTQHPVAIGSPISDHAFRLPATLSMRVAWSNSNLAGTVMGSVMGTGGGASPWSGFTETRAKEIYETLRDFQGTDDGEQVKLINITTGKREYRNMVLVELAVTTDHTKEYALFVDASFQQVTLVRTLSTTQATTAEQADPSKTAETTNSPAKQPYDNSVFRDMAPGSPGASKFGVPNPPNVGGDIRPIIPGLPGIA